MSLSRLKFSALTAAVLVLSLAGCTSPRTTNKASAAVPAPLVFTEAVVERPVDATLTRPSLQKAYYVGRIVDPKYPELMHGAGVVFRRERSETWNTNANAPAVHADYVSGPVRTMPNGAETPSMTAADAEIHEARTSAIVDALLEQNAELTDKLAEAAKTPPQQQSQPAAVDAPVSSSSMARPATGSTPAPTVNSVNAPASQSDLVTIAPSADNVIELSPALLEPPIPGLTNPFRQRYQFETQLRETKVVVSGIALGPQPSCVLGERIYNVGDSFDSFVVAGIDADGIFLRKESFLLRIPMQEAPIVLRYP